MKTYTEEEKHRLKGFWTGATWMPWDDCPVGERVITHNQQIGSVESVYAGHIGQEHDCPDCTHLGEPRFVGWWHVKLDDPVLLAWGEKMDIVLEFPGNLRKYEERH